MTNSEKARQILDQFGVEHGGLELMIEEALNEASAEGWDHCKRALNGRLSRLRETQKRHPRKAFIANVVHTLEDVLEDLDALESL